jgi:hypothetical protein
MGWKEACRKGLAITSLACWAVSSGGIQLPAPGPAGKAAIHGVVRDSSELQAVGGALVTIECGSYSDEVETTEDGRFRFEGVPAGPCLARVDVKGIRRERELLALPGDEGQEIVLLAPLPASLSGRVIGDGGRPVANADVWLLEREVTLGITRLMVRGAAKTSETGEFTLQAPAGRPLLVLSTPPARPFPPETMEIEPERRPMLEIAGFYIGSRTPEGATPLRLDHRFPMTGAVIQLDSARPYCVEGAVEAAASGQGSFHLRVVDQALWPGSVGFAAGIPAKAAPGGAFRVCGIAPGDYKLIAWQDAGSGEGFYGSASFRISDSDIRGLRVPAEATVSLRGQVRLDQQNARQEPMEVEIWLSPLSGVNLANVGGQIVRRATVPGAVVWPSLRIEPYRVNVSPLPYPCYVRSLQYGSQDLLHAPLVPGTEIAGAELDAVLACDGGLITATVADASGKPLPDVTVVAAPEESRTSPRLADEVMAGRTDKQGVWRSPVLRPGRYRVAVLPQEVVKSPEGLLQLAGELGRGQEVEVHGAGQRTVRISIRW